jgi:CHASE3 domain sensor protein
VNSRRRSLLVLGSVAIFVIIAAGSLVFLERLQARHRRQTADVVQREEQLAGLLQDLRSNALLETSATAGYISLRDPSLISSFYTAKSQAEHLLDQLSSVSAGDAPLAKEVRELSELHGDISTVFAQIVQSSESGTDIAAITGAIPADFPSVARRFPERIRVAADAASARLIDA